MLYELNEEPMEKFTFINKVNYLSPTSMDNTSGPKIEPDRVASV